MKIQKRDLLKNSKAILTALSFSLSFSIAIAPNARAEDATAKAKPPVAQALSKDEEAVFIRVQKVVVKQLNKKVEDVKLESRLIQDLGADSLDSVELVMAIEEEFRTSIPDADAETLKTVKDIVRYISKATGLSKAPAPTKQTQSKAKTGK